MKCGLCNTKLNAPVTVSDEVRERVARGLCLVDVDDADSPVGEDARPIWMLYLEEADAAIAALQETGDDDNS